ncbi:PREDICTED: lactation elevated protein 1 [Lupinus angustifolius]|uniref:lactation elevated protein 1 n=1 Tax=Lupinus angustifolius TaxID=3871 RepID=UPI00092E2F4E|nr:PREDICTED: lactation elevated protein 1 [Lupinus angustifolius]
MGTKLRHITLPLRSYSILSNPPGPLVKYRNLIKEGKLQHDPFQEGVASQLQNLLQRLDQYEKQMEQYHVNLSNWEKNRENERRRLLTEEAELHQKEEDWWKRLNSKLSDRWVSRKRPKNMEAGVGQWVSYLKREKKLNSVVGQRPIAPTSPKGLYIYGNVGSGKTMLMDMFYSATEGIVKHRRRYHFHEAMLRINEHMHKIWKNQVEEKPLKSSISGWIMNLPFDTKAKEWLAAEERYNQEVHLKNILPAVADKFFLDQEEDEKGASILCFDEIQTVDVFAIVALSGILSRLLNSGTIIVATSNRAPEDLNEAGMQREIFQKLVRKLEEHCENVLIGSEIDYRRFIAQKAVNQIEGENNRSPRIGSYFWPIEMEAINKFEEKWHDVTSRLGGRIVSNTISVMFGRTLEVPESCEGVARFTFEYLCGRPLGAADYIAVAENYHTVFISDIPMMSMRIRDKARRFITLIDELYNRHCCLCCLASSSIDELFQGTEEGTLFDLESFQFETETEGAKLRRDVLAEGNLGSGGGPVGITSILSGQEEMFAFQRAVSRLIEMQTPLYLDGITNFHPFFQRQHHKLLSESSI